MPSTMKRIIEQEKPFESLEQEAFLMLARLSNQMSAEHAELFKASGITFTQYNALRILRGAEGEALSCSQIGARMITRDTDVTRLLDRLETQGLVERARDEHDRRVVKARITDAGRAVLADLEEPVAALHRRQLGHLGEAKLGKLLSLLEEAAAPER